MSRIQKKINEWAASGLISSEQAQKISDYELQHNSRSWALWGVIIVGVSAIAIGIISIIAANWQYTPAYLKLMSYIAIQSLLGYFVWKQIEKKGLVREALITFFALMFFSGIGVVGQVFNLKSDGYSAIFFWCGLTFLVVQLSASRAINYIWVSALIIGQTLLLVKQLDMVRDFNAVRYLNSNLLILYVYLAIGLFQYHKIRLSAAFSEALRVIPFLIIFLGGTVVGTLFWYIDLSSFLTKSTEEVKFLTELKFIPWIGAGIVSAAIFFRSPGFEQRLKVSLSLLFFVLAAFVTIPVFFELSSHKALGAIFSVALWAVAAIVAICADKRRIFDAITFCICFRLLAIYFEVFGSLMATGIGLIISGVMILAVAWVWYKYRSKLANLIMSRT